MTPSFGYRAIQVALRLTRLRFRMLKDAPRGLQRNMLPSRRQRQRWERSEFEGRAVWLCHPGSGETKSVYVHEHGGGYIYGLQSIHYMALQELCDYAQMRVILPDYPLPPDAHAPEMIAWADRHFASVVDCYGLENVALGGCSAGGNLTMAILQSRAARGEPNPETVILWSPWLDLTEAETPPTKAEDYEALITPFGLEPAVGAYLGNTDMDRADPLISPLFADLSNLPTLNIVTGQQDVLYPAIAEFSEKARGAGKLGKYVAEPDYGHYWMFYPVRDRHPTLKQIAGMLG
ncbi:MAG: alpha/beta hydrolase [Pseudomonadota bacterium]